MSIFSDSQEGSNLMDSSGAKSGRLIKVWEVGKPKKISIINQNFNLCHLFSIVLTLWGTLIQKGIGEKISGDLLATPLILVS